MGLCPLSRANLFLYLKFIEDQRNPPANGETLKSLILWVEIWELHTSTI